MNNQGVDKLWIAWLIGAILTFIVFAFPTLVIVGFALLFVPGALLWITPPIFIYGSMACLIWRGLPNFPRLRVSLIVILITAISVALPVTINHFKDKNIALLKQNDVPLTQEPLLLDTVAFLFAPKGDSMESVKEMKVSKFWQHDVECNEVCQRLLYNGSVRRVMISTSSDSVDGLPDEQSNLAAFRVERRANCPPPPATTSSPDWREMWPERAYADNTNRRVLKRIAAGECLLRETASLRDAQIIYVERKVFFAAGENGWALSATLYTLHRIELLRRSGESIVPLYRSTYVDSSQLFVPLILSVANANFFFGASTGFIRESDNPTVPGIGALAQSMFGSAANMPLPLEPEPHQGGIYLCGFTDVTCKKIESP